MSMHVTSQRLQQLRRRELTPEEIVEVTRHLAACAECAAAARREIDLGRAAAGLADAALADEHPDVEREIFPYADGTLDADGRSAIEDHLATCATCAEVVDDLRRIDARTPRRSWPTIWLGAVAAAAIVAIIAIPLFRERPINPAPSRPPRVQQQPSVSASGYRSDWAAAIRAALAHGIPLPASLRAIHPPADALRDDSGDTAHVALRPRDVVVESQQPRFTWSKIGRACRVAVYSGDQRVSRSPRLIGNEWTPAAPLPRGRIYTWQLEAEGEGPHILPEPPDPPAIFRIIDEATKRELDDARRLHPDDHLLLGVLEAQAGLQEEALRDLGRHVVTHPDDAAARRLAASVREW